MLLQAALYLRTHLQSQGWNWKLIFATVFVVQRKEISLFGFPDKGVSNKLIKEYNVFKFYLEFTNEIQDCHASATKRT